MNYFLDCEFIEDGRTIYLISIALVAEDGREYYACSKEFDLQRVHPWLWENVMPHLPQFGAISTATTNEHGDERPMWLSRKEIARDLVAFVGQGRADGQLGTSYPDGKQPVFWAWYGAYDWVALMQLFGPMIEKPDGWPMYVHDLKQLADALGNPTIPRREGVAVHDALEDARENQWRYEWLRHYERELERKQERGER